MENIVVADLMTRDPATISPKKSLLEAAKIMVRKRVGSLPIVNDNCLVGFITQKDILWALIKKSKKDLATIKTIDISPKKIAVIKPDAIIKDAFEYGVKVTGVTVHFVDEQMDHGPIVLQSALKIEDTDTLESLEAKIHRIEHKIYPEAVSLFVKGKLKVAGRRVTRV